MSIKATSKSADAVTAYSEVLADNPARTRLLVQNRHGSDAVFLNLDGAPSADTDAISLAAGVMMEINGTGAIFAKRGLIADIPLAFIEETAVNP